MDDPREASRRTGRRIDIEPDGPTIERTRARRLGSAELTYWLGSARGRHAVGETGDAARVASRLTRFTASLYTSCICPPALTGG